MSAVCPCCNRPFEGQPDMVEVVKRLPFGPVARQILGLVAAGDGSVVSSNDIAFTVYGDNRGSRKSSSTRR